MSEEQPSAKIEITLAPDNISWQTELTEVELVFWLETVKLMVLQKILSTDA